jgi:2-methylisocitrate lyase-like PEP mutase family enzyme
MAATTSQREKAEALRRLHSGPEILIIVNAWDAISARIFEQAGCRALGTTSAGIANVLGYPDGEHISRAEMLEVVRRIAGRVAVPLTADMEAGYGPTPEDAAETVRGVLAAGAVGLNLEDGSVQPGEPLLDVALQVDRLRAAREAGDSAGVPIVINARTDVFLRGVGEPADRLGHAVRRANAYREAGADCLFIPGAYDADTIAALARAVAGPINILAGPMTPPIPELARLGVARVSVGSGAHRATLALARRIVQELLGPGTYEGFTRDAIPYVEVNQLLEDADD